MREQLMQRMSDPDRQQRYRQRKAMVEPVFSVLRLRQGLTRFRRRHAHGARVELMLHLMAYNLSRVVATRLLHQIWPSIQLRRLIRALSAAKTFPLSVATALECP